MNDPLLEAACRSLGLDGRDMSFLGRGYFGSAYATRNGSVLKVTRDPSEIALVGLGQSHESRGLPVIFRPPVEVSPGTYAYEREDLSNFPFECPLLSAMTIVAKPIIPMPMAQRIACYDTILYGQEASDSYPFVVDALRRFRRHGVLVWDLKRSNLGYRGDDIVIRDGRCLRIGPREE